MHRCMQFMHAMREYLYTCLHYIYAIYNDHVMKKYCRCIK